jgi:hypothetical protein
MAKSPRSVLYRGVCRKIASSFAGASQISIQGGKNDEQKKEASLRRGREIMGYMTWINDKRIGQMDRCRR